MVLRIVRERRTYLFRDNAVAAAFEMKHSLPAVNKFLKKKLGATVDGDFDGQPHPNALGDNLDGHNDNDGVVFTSLLVAGETGTLEVTAVSAPRG